MWNGNGWKIGDNYAVCDVCGHEYLASVLRERWDGLVVCPDDYETRHPQEFVRAVQDDQRAKGFIRLEPPDDFRLTACNSENRVAIAEVAIAGCMIAGLDEGEPTITGFISGSFNEETL